MKLILLALCALLPCIAHSADNQTTVLFRFLDQTGIYKIKIEPVKNVVVTMVEGKKTAQYDPIETLECVHEQDDHEDFLMYINLPKETKMLRISIRKQGENGEFKRGGYMFVNAKKLFAGADPLRMDKQRAFGIMLKDAFESLVNGQRAYTLGADSIFVNCRR